MQNRQSKRSLAVVTMVRADHHWARLWLAHYSRQVQNKTDLYVIIHGDDPVLRDLFRDCSVLHVPLGENDTGDFEAQRLEMKHFLIKAVQVYFNCVLLVDIDEFVTVAPDVGGPLWKYLPRVHAGEIVRSPLGIEIIEHPDEDYAPIDLEQPVLAQRPWGYCNGQYCKPCAFYLHAGLASHHRVWGAPWVIDPNLILFHLRYCDRRLLQHYARSRKQYFAAQQQAGQESSLSWRAPGQHYQATLRYLGTQAPGILDLETRQALRRRILEDFMRTDRVGQISSGFLKLPGDYHGLF